MVSTDAALPKVTAPGPLTALQDEPKAARFERELLEALFGSKVKSGEQVSLSEVKGRFAAAQPQIQRHLYDELVERGYFTTSPERTRSRWNARQELDASRRAFGPAYPRAERLQLRQPRDDRFADLGRFEQLDAAAPDRDIAKRHLEIERTKAPDEDV